VARIAAGAWQTMAKGLPEAVDRLRRLVERRQTAAFTRHYKATHLSKSEVGQRNVDAHLLAPAIGGPPTTPERAPSMLDRRGLTALIVVHDGVGQMHADPQGDEDQ
jgi:hypothetical protein